MRHMRMTGIAALAMSLVVMSAWAQSPGSKGRSRANQPDRNPPPAQALEPRMPGEVPELQGDDDAGMEPMDGPDAWDLMDMGPAGLYVTGPPGRGDPIRLRALIARRQELAKQLDLSEAQRDRIEAIRDRQLRFGIEQRAKLRLASLDLRSMLRAERLERTALEAKVDEISRIQAALRKARLTMLLDMRGVLTPEQQKKLRDLRGAGPDGEI